MTVFSLVKPISLVQRSLACDGNLTFYVSCWEIASPNILKISQHVSPNFLVLRTVNFNNLVADNQTTCVQTPRELKLFNQAGHRPGIGARSIKGAQEWVVLQTWANLYLRQILIYTVLIFTLQSYNYNIYIMQMGHGSQLTRPILILALGYALYNKNR